MTCSELDELLSDYLDGELSHLRRADCEGHLADCEWCRNYLSTYGATIRLAKDAFTSSPDRGDENTEELVWAALTQRFADAFGSQPRADTLYFG